MADKNDKDKDIEIIPPGASQRRGGEEWIYISLDDSARAFKALPLHKRILLGLSWFAGLVVLGVILFLIVASAVLIWIPLLIAIALVTAAVVFFRTRLFRR